MFFFRKIITQKLFFRYDTLGIKGLKLYISHKWTSMTAPFLGGLFI